MQRKMKKNTTFLFYYTLGRRLYCDPKGPFGWRLSLIFLIHSRSDAKVPIRRTLTENHLSPVIRETTGVFRESRGVWGYDIR